MSDTASDATPRTRRRAWVLGLGGLTLVAGAGLGVRWVSADDRPPRATVPRDVPRFDDGAIRYSATYAERIGLHTEEAREHTLAPTIEVTGTVERSPAHVAAVGSRIFGRVRSVEALVGQSVEEGQPLATLESAALGEAQAQMTSARARERLARAEHRRKQVLVDEGVAAHRSVELTRRELDAAQALRRAAEQRVRAMAGRRRARGALGELVLRAPISGEVTQASVHLGQSVEPDHVAFEVTDLQHLWLELAVFSRDLRLVGVGDEVVVRPYGDDATVVRGRVANVGSVIDELTRTAAVRVELDNQDRALRIGQAVRARIVSHGSEVHALAVPRRAVVLVDGAPTVFVSPADGQVMPRRVELGVLDLERAEVRDGLALGERVVVDGVFELKSELFR